MDRLGTLRNHFVYDDWANERVLTALREDGEGTERGGKGLRLLAHIVAARRMWRGRITGMDTSEIVLWPDEVHLEELETLQREDREAWTEYLEGINAMSLDGIVSYENTKGTSFRTPLGEILEHLHLHGAYHRGQIASWMRSEGREPVNTDFITFVRMEGQL